MRKSIFFTLSVLFFVFTAQETILAQEKADVSTTTGQPYEAAIGGRISNGLGLTYKKSLKDNKALEFIVSFPSFDGIRASALYEMHESIEDVKGLRWYYGGGVIVRYYNFEFLDDYFAFGVSGIAGLEYKLNNKPLLLSIDYAPGIYIFDTFANFGYGADWGSGVGLSVRYILK